MIYPTGRAVLLTALGAPLGLGLGVAAPSLWVAGVAWMGLCLGLMLVDAWAGADPRRTVAVVEAPGLIGVGAKGEAVVRLTFGRGAPATVELALEAGPRLAVSPDRMICRLRQGDGEARFDLLPARRGEGRLERLFLRWTGPLGLVWKQAVQPLDRTVALTPNIRGVQDEAVRLFARESLFGLKSQLQTGEGSEYHALKEFMPGHDAGAIDWKQSARHAKLLVKEFRTERNHHLVFALDTGRLMCEPIGGAPRIDRALNAALLMAYVGLKMGDRVGLYGFDARPRLSTGVVAGTAAFATLQRLAASLDYGAEETNFTLGLTTLAESLERRSLVVVFTDFADATSAQLMLENLGRLTRRHLVLFVTFRDEELEALARAAPDTPRQVSRAVIAGALLRERELVIARLRRMGVEILEAHADRLGPQLLSRYLELKQRDML